MSSIQDIYALEERIYHYVGEYLGGIYAADYVLAISSNYDEVPLKADSRDYKDRVFHRDICSLDDRDVINTRY